MDPTETVEEYYQALRRGEPLSPYFSDREDVVKFGVSERLAGYEAVAEGLREQSRTTEDWQVESERLQVVTLESETETSGGSEVETNGRPADERDEISASASVARFTDDVALSWTDSSEERQSFDTRWSGVLERADRGGRKDRSDRDDRNDRDNRIDSNGRNDRDDRSDPNGRNDRDDGTAGANWRFVQMHVSAPQEL
jgi:hypothetical protein